MQAGLWNSGELKEQIAIVHGRLTFSVDTVNSCASWWLHGVVLQPTGSSVERSVRLGLCKAKTRIKDSTLRLVLYAVCRSVQKTSFDHV